MRQRAILAKAIKNKAEFARICGISRKHLDEILAGRTGLSIQVAEMIATCATEIGCTIDPFTLMKENKQ